MNWKLLLLTLTLILGISARPADDNSQETSTLKSLKETTNLTERPTIVTDSPIEIVTKKITKTTEKVPVSDSIATSHVPTTTSRNERQNDIVEDKPADENRELKADSKLQLTSGNVNSEITLKESFHHGVAVPLSLEDYEKELAREKELLTKAKKKISMESSTPKEGISTWILLSGSNNPTTTSRPEVNNKPVYRVDNENKKPAVKNNISNTNSTQTTKKRTTVTHSPKTTKTTTTKPINNKLITRVKATPNNEAKVVTEEPQASTTASTTKKVSLTTKPKKFTTQRPKTTHAKTTTTVATTTVELTTAAPKKKDGQKDDAVIVDDSMVIDDEKDEPEVIETSTYLIMEAKDDEFNLPNDRSPAKSSSSKKGSAKTTASPKNKKKKIAAAVVDAATNSTTKIKKNKDKKTALTKVSNNKKPEKPISTQIYNYLAREVMPTVGVGLVGLVVTAGLATYFLGGPLTALRRSYDIASRRDDVGILDRSDDFGNMQDEGEMFGKVIAGMPENSPYRNNIRVNSYHVKNHPYPSYPGPQYSQQTQQVNKYGVAPPVAQQLKQQQYQQQLAQQQQQVQSQQQYLRYRAADPYYNSYPKNQYYPQQVQPKSSNYGPQTIQAAENAPKFNIDTVDMTTSEPSSSSYSMDYDEIAQSYFPQHDDEPSPTSQITVEQQKIQEIESKPQPQYVQPMESERSEKVTIINAQSVPTNHKNENDHDHEEHDESPLPTPEALKMPSLDEEYQNSIANAILNQNQKKFVVGSVIAADNYEENAASSVPEHGPRRRRKREASKKPAAKSLDNNEIDEDERVEKPKRDSEAETEIVTTTLASSTHESATHELENETTVEAEKAEETTSATPTYDISPGQNNIFNLFRRIVELKLRLGLNFLQNATLAFQEYLRGVEARVQASPLFNPYMNTTNSTEMSRKSSKLQRKKVANL